MTPDIVYNLGRLKQIPGKAIFSEDKLYRYTLTREWGRGDKTCIFIMCNPSTADENILDPTVRKCLEWSITWGYDKLLILNLFAWRATNPKEIYKVKNPIGLVNDNYILEAMQTYKKDLYIAAWGANGKYMQRSDAVRFIADCAGIKLNILRITPNGHPEHPLYLSKSLMPIPWRNNDTNIITE